VLGIWIWIQLDPDLFVGSGSGNFDRIPEPDPDPDPTPKDAYYQSEKVIFHSNIFRFFAFQQTIKKLQKFLSKLF
jgi:hypothetical protein